MCPVHISNFSVKVDGTAVSADFMRSVQDIVVDSSLYMPSMFTIRLDDHDLKWVDDSSLDIGKEVEITAEAGEELGSGSGLLFKGEITGLEPESIAGRSNSLVVRGYDKSHRLHRGRKTRTFLKKTDSNIAQTLAQEAGLTAQVDATSVTYPWVLQSNQTNMEFLQARAARIGYQVFCIEGDLYFKKGDAKLGDGPELEYGVQLLEFRPRWTANRQADDVTVYAWDPCGKQALVSSAKAPSSSLNQGGMSQTGGAKTSSAFSSAQEFIADQPVLTVDEANALAEGLSNDIGRAFVQAEGVSFGDPKVMPGYTITVKGVGTRFSGSYYVTSARHILANGQYETRFAISGRQPNTLNYLLRPGNGHGLAEGRVQGVVTALVTQLEDEEDVGRIKVKYPWLPKYNDVEVESDWIRIASPMAGAQRGFQFLPEIDDEVLIAFEHGDVHRPYLVGVLWSDTDKPPKGKADLVADGKVVQHVLVTRSGHEIVFGDKEDEELISVTTKSGHKVILDDKSGSEKITICDKTGKNEMVIDSAANSMTISVEGDFSVTAKGKINLTSTGDMTLDATGNGSFKGMQLALEGTSKSEMKAPQIAVKADGQVEVSSGGMATLKSSGMTKIQGSLVQIN